jgi:hypothetical protein
MRCFLCAFFLCCSVAAQSQSLRSPNSNAGNGTFYVNGIVYHHVAGTDYTVVAAAHSVINHKFVAVKIRVYNVGQQSVTIKPEEVSSQDTVAGQALIMVSSTELARRMRRPYNWARLAVNPVMGEPTDASPASDTVNSQLLEMMRAMAAHVNRAGTPMLPGNSGALYTDTPRALQSRRPTPTAECDTVCELRNREAANPDVLTQLQRQNSPAYVEQSAFLANTITPQSDVDGILYFSMPKLTRGVPLAKNGNKAGTIRVTVPVGEEKFEFLLVVE